VCGENWASSGEVRRAEAAARLFAPLGQLREKVGFFVSIFFGGARQRGSKTKHTHTNKG